MYNAAGYDVSAKGLLLENDVYKMESDGYFQINKTDIKGVENEKAIVTLADGSKHTFNYGALNVDRMAGVYK